MESVLEPVRDTFRALATTIVPEAAELDADGWAELERIIEDALSTRSPKVKRQLQVLIRALRLGPLPSYRRTFTALDPERRTRFLHGIEHSRLLLLRRGFWGLRTLVFMGYYARPAATAAIRYRADPHGWEARRGAAAAAVTHAESAANRAPAGRARPSADAGADAGEAP